LTTGFVKLLKAREKIYKAVAYCADSVRTVETLDQRYVLMPAAVKDAYLVHIVHEYLQTNSSSSIMIFTNTCKSVILPALPVCVHFNGHFVI